MRPPNRHNPEPSIAARVEQVRSIANRRRRGRPAAPDTMRGGRGGMGRTIERLRSSLR